MTVLAEIDEKDPTKIVIENWEKRFKSLYDSIPTAKYNRMRDVYQFNLVWPACLALHNTLGDRVVIGEKLKEWTKQFYTETILPAYNLRDKTTEEGSDNLYEHQKADVKFLATAKTAILANGMGSGKSISSVSALKYLHEQGEDVLPVLIACPNSTKYAWEDEIQKAWPGRTVAVIDGAAPKRKKALASGADFIVMNWESLKSHSRLKPFGSVSLKKCTDCGGLDPNLKVGSCEVHEKELNTIEFKSAIGDEAHRMKDPASKQARAFKAATVGTTFRFALSGTPLASQPDDLFSILNWLMPTSYPSKVKYIDRYCETGHNPWGMAEIVTGIRKDREQEFFNCLDPYLRRMPKELILPFLPPIVRTRRDVEMGAKQKKAYNQMKDQMIAEVDNDDVVYTTSPLVRMTRMLQFSSSYANLEEVPVFNQETQEHETQLKVVLSDPSCKLDAFMEDIPEFADESVVVFANSKQLINLLAKRLDKANIDYGLITGDQDAVERKHYMKRFQEGAIQFILCTISAGGTGITLTKGSKAVFLQRSWSMIENQQAEARCHRIGSEQYESIQIIDYVTSGSCEEMVFKAVEAKGEQLEYILRDADLMKKVLKNEPIEIEEVEPEENNEPDENEEESE